MTYRIFTNDRGKKKGVFMYSAFMTFSAQSADEAEELAELKYGPFAYAGPHGPVKAIEWPPTTEASKSWLARHT